MSFKVSLDDHVARKKSKGWTHAFAGGVDLETKSMIAPFGLG
jgi:hypothetical protein